MKAVCQLCAEIYATVDLKTLRYPMTGAMFSSADPYHGQDPPFNVLQVYEDMRCPYGRNHRPMVRDDAILTEQGMVRLPKDGSPAFLDPTLSSEIDRTSIIDRVITISDQDAEAIARAAEDEAKTLRVIGGQTSVLGMDKGVIVPVPVAGEEGLFIPVFVKDESFPCPTCGKQFSTIKAMKGHVGGAHSRKGRDA